MSDVLKTEKLNVCYGTRQILKDVSINVAKGEIVGLVGESGCGKSTFAKAVCGLIKKKSGDIYVSDMPKMIFQDPFGSLNPAFTIRRILEEPLRIGKVRDSSKRNEIIDDIIKRVGLQTDILDSYPNELSGGQRQRVSISLSLISNPSLLIADEPVSALDVTIQKKVLTLLYELNRDLDIGILFISHDLKVVYQMCSRIYIMKDGEIVESGSDDDIFKNPQNDYTKSLLKAAM